MSGRRNWTTDFRDLQQCIQEMGEVPDENSLNREISRLGAWAKSQRQIYITRGLPKDKEEKLNRLHPGILNPHNQRIVTHQRLQNQTSRKRSHQELTTNRSNTNSNTNSNSNSPHWNNLYKELRHFIEANHGLPKSERSDPRLTTFIQQQRDLLRMKKLSKDMTDRLNLLHPEILNPPRPGDNKKIHRTSDKSSPATPVETTIKPKKFITHFQLSGFPAAATAAAAAAAAAEGKKHTSTDAEVFMKGLKVKSSDFGVIQKSIIKADGTIDLICIHEKSACYIQEMLQSPEMNTSSIESLTVCISQLPVETS